MEERDIPLQAPRDDGKLIDVLDRVLDKGIVIDAWARMSVVGIDLLSVEMKVVVASIETPRPYDEIAAENVALRAQIEAGPGAAARAPAGRRRTRQ